MIVGIVRRHLLEKEELVVVPHLNIGMDRQVGLVQLVEVVVVFLVLAVVLVVVLVVLVPHLNMGQVMVVVLVLVLLVLTVTLFEVPRSPVVLGGGTK